MERPDIVIDVELSMLLLFTSYTEVEIPLSQTYMNLTYAAVDPHYWARPPKLAFQLRYLFGMDTMASMYFPDLVRSYVRSAFKS